MRIFGSILSSWAIGSILLGIFCMTPSLKKGVHLDRVLDSLVANFVRNFSIFCILTYSLSRLKISFTQIVIIEMGILGCIYIKVLVDSNFTTIVRTTISNLKRLLSLSTLSVIVYLPALIKTGINGSIFGLSTIGNNDVAFYSLTASEFLKTGFVDSQNIVNQDLNSTAFIQHQAANLIVALTSTIFQLQTWQTFNGIMIFCISSAILGSAYLCKTFFPMANEKISLLVGTIVLASPALTYIVGQVFLGQITSIPIAAITLGVFIRLSSANSVNMPIDRIQLAYLFILSSIVYPVFLLPVFFGSLVLYLLLRILQNRRSFFVECYHDLPYILVGVLLSIPYLPTAIHLLFFLNSAEAGWPLKSITPASLIVLGKLIGYSLNDYLVVFLWILSAYTFYFVISRIKTSLTREELFSRKVLLFGLAVLYIFAVEVRDGDYSYYQNWKLLMYFFPILYTLFLTDLIRLTRIRLVVLSPFILFSFFAPMLQWIPAINNGVGILTKEMSDLHSNPDIQRYSAINIGTRPYFDSMVIADILENKKVFIASKTTMSVLQSPTACTLVDLRDDEFSKVQLLNETYGLIPSIEPGCEIQNATDNFLKVKMNETVNFKINSEGIRALADRWSSPENWGVWSLGDRASIHLKIIEPRAGSNWIEILGSPFMNPNLKNTKVVFDSPLFEKKVFTFITSDTPQVIRIALLPDALMKSKGNVDIFIETPDNISPKKLGISEDTRPLGFGMITLKFVDSVTR